MTKKSNQSNDKFSSQLGVILAAAGSAIGVGNIWRFSYVVGKHGGGAFLLVYLLCVFLLGLPVLLAEITIGRSTGKSDIAAFNQIAPNTPWWIVGALGIIGPLLILFYYPLIAGWSIGYVFESIFNWGALSANPTLAFEAFTSNPNKSLFFNLIAIILTALTLVGGVSKGIEKWNKILMPALIVIMIILIVRSLTLDGAMAGVSFLFKPDFSKINTNVFLEALGHAFYSLSVGMGIMITYGSYINKKENLVTTALNVIGLDTITALMAGLAIFPAVFAFNLEPNSGPGLAFITLTQALATMPGGQIFAILFFLLLVISALSSLMSLMQVLVAFMEHKFKIKKKTILAIIVVILFIFGIPSALSFSSLKDFKIFGLTYFDFMDNLTANFIIPITGLLISLFVIFQYGVKNSQKEIATGCPNAKKSIIIRIYPFLIKYIAPIAIIFVLLNATVFKWFFK